MKRLYIVTVEAEFEYAALAESEQEAESFAREAEHDAYPEFCASARRAAGRFPKGDGSTASLREKVFDPPVYGSHKGDITWNEAVEIERQAQDAEAAAEYAAKHQLPLPGTEVAG